jgi:RNA-directed DNA polymerase
MAYCAGAWHKRSSTAEPCSLCLIVPFAINILPLKAKVKYWDTTSPTPHYPFKFEITFCVRGVLSPLLSNLVLDQLDRELERRGHRFARYADDCNIYVRSRRAGQRLMGGLTRLLEGKLKLKVNREKSAVARPWERKFLGFSFTNGRQPKRRIAPKAKSRFEARIRILTRRTRGISIETMVRELGRYLQGWQGYFGFCQTPTVLDRFNKWIRRRLRSAACKQWRTGKTRYARLRELGLSHDLAARTAGHQWGPWRLSRTEALSYAMPAAYFDRLGLPSLRCTPGA